MIFVLQFPLCNKSIQIHRLTEVFVRVIVLDLYAIQIKYLLTQDGLIHVIFVGCVAYCDAMPWIRHHLL